MQGEGRHSKHQVVGPMQEFVGKQLAKENIYFIMDRSDDGLKWPVINEKNKSSIDSTCYSTSNLTPLPQKTLQTVTAWHYEMKSLIIYFIHLLRTYYVNIYITLVI